MSLVGGKSPAEGNVFISDEPLCHYYGYRTWDWDEAAVVCRDLGYNHVKQITGDSYFGEVPDWYMYSTRYLSCNGKEDTIADCNSYSDYKHPCTKTTGAGVICSHSKPSKSLGCFYELIFDSYKIIL